MDNKILTKKNSGFTLLGLIVSIFIIGMSLSAIMALISYLVSASTASASRLVAANLAQEGIEVVRNIRDFNFVDASGWANWYNQFIAGTTYDYSVQYDDYSQSEAAWRDYDPNIFLLYNSATGLYSYTDANGINSIYKRKVSLTRAPELPPNDNPNDNPNEMKVVSEVTWTENGRSNIIIVEDRLWNWR
jgi:type II secretory pathway pseudopilin PulG